MKAIELKGVSYKYPEREKYALFELDLNISEGEFVLVVGPSGCGKSTLCRLLNGLIPHYCGGTLEGTVSVDGLRTSEHTTAEMSTHVGLVFQNPEDQILMPDVEDELAFGLENLGMRPVDIGERIGWVARRLGIVSLIGRKTDELSGGEKQKVVLASVLAMKPRILVLDEPTSQLDPESRRDLFSLLKSLNDDGMTIVLVEHNTHEVADYVQRVFDMESGEWTEPRRERRPDRMPERKTGETLLAAHGLAGGYGIKKVFGGLELTVRRGECLAVTGRNGSGKTTLVKHFNGLLKPLEGSVTVCGLDTRTTPTETLAAKVAYLPQNPTDMLFAETAEDELKFTLDHLGIEGDVEGTLRRFGLVEHRLAFPRDLSVGQRQRLALAAVLVGEREIVVLDEPTRGIDRVFRGELVRELRSMSASGKALIVVTQDADLVEEVATRELRMGDKI